MKDINIYKAENVSEISDFLKENGEKARVMAGGTDLVGTLKDKILPEEIDQIVSMKDIDELSGISENNDFISVGAMTTLSEIEKSSVISKNFPLLAEAARTVASPQIRHIATIGGNICQEPRCWYYRYHDDKFNCIRKGGDRCNAIVGNNLYHSVYGASRVSDTPCTANCPNGTNIAAYMARIRKGDIEGAARILFSVNPLASVTGRICPHTCEQHCNRRGYDASVAVRAAERFLGDYILDNRERFYKAPERENGRKAAIVGSGPAGLAAAYYLRASGFSVTVLDQNEEAGGMLFYGIPEYRLPKDIIRKLRDILEGMGVVFRMGVKVGKDITVDTLSSDFDILILGIGAWVSTNLEFEGRDADGVMGALDFLYRIAGKKEQNIGNKVVVIGGGNTSLDVCRSALKMGASEVTLLTRKPLDEIAAEKEEIEDALLEGVKILDLTTLKKVIKNPDNSIKGLELQKMRKLDEEASDSSNLVPDEGNTEIIDADNLILALGQGIDTSGFDRLSDKRGIEVKEEASGRTAEENIFAAGDAAHAATVVKSIYQARKAAESICSDLSEKYSNYAIVGDEKGFNLKALDKTERVKITEVPLDKRSLYEEISETISEAGLCGEADRCLNCGCVAVSPSDTGAALAALDAVIVTNEREIPVSEFFSTPVMGSTSLEAGEIVTEIRIPRSVGNRQSYFKHRTRKSIDFPIISIAINGDIEGKIVKDIHIVFGAVAPVPRKMTEVEDFLRGKELTEDVIREASELSVRDCIALKENEYKIKTLKVLFRRELEKMI